MQTAEDSINKDFFVFLCVLSILKGTYNDLIVRSLYGSFLDKGLPLILLLMSNVYHYNLHSNVLHYDAVWARIRAYHQLSVYVREKSIFFLLKSYAFENNVYS